MSRKDDNKQKEKLTGNRMTRRKALMASSGLSGALFAVPAVAAGRESDNERNKTPLTEKELLDTLNESEHIYVNPKVHQEVTEERTGFQTLDQSDTPGNSDPDIYYGENKNSEPPSGEFYEISEEGAWRDRDLPIALSGHKSNNIQPLSSDYFTVGGEIGSTNIGGYEVNVAFNTGLQLSGTLDGKIGGELIADFTFTAAGQSVTISPGGFGFWVGPNKTDGWCVVPKVNLPGPLPGADVDLCGDVKVYTRSGPEIRFGLEFTGLDICTDPCPYVTCNVCGTVVSVGVEFRTPWISESDLPIDIPWV